MSVQGCSVENVFRELRRYPAPGNPTNRLVSAGDITPVRILGIPGGNVVHIVDSINNIIINRTIVGHIFNPGTVTRTVSVDNSGNVVIRTFGKGIGLFPGVNKVVGKAVFRSLDNTIFRKFNPDNAFYGS